MDKTIKVVNWSYQKLDLHNHEQVAEDLEETEEVVVDDVVATVVETTVVTVETKVWIKIIWSNFSIIFLRQRRNLLPFFCQFYIMRLCQKKFRSPSRKYNHQKRT
jgi:hypothetical protein